MDSNLIVLTDQDGNSVRFELLDIVEYKEDEYAVLYPADGGDDDFYLSHAGKMLLFLYSNFSSFFEYFSNIAASGENISF